jgi:hypothetical protein
MTILPILQENHQKVAFVPSGTAAAALLTRVEIALRLEIFPAFIQYD